MTDLREPTPLETALFREEKTVRSAIDLLDDYDDHALNGAARSLRMTHALVGCLRRLTQGRSVREIHDAFGAPGDYGYETPVGAALADLYGHHSQPVTPTKQLQARIAHARGVVVTAEKNSLAATRLAPADWKLIVQALDAYESLITGAL